MNDILFRALLNATMCYDPAPREENEALVSFVEAEARQRGYQSWVDAYHMFDVKGGDDA